MFIENETDYEIKPIEFKHLININNRTKTFGSGRKQRNFYIPEKIGVYMFFNSSRKCMYVGYSSNLCARYSYHVYVSNSSAVNMAITKNPNSIVYYTYATCETEVDALLYEKL